jgi:DNA-binding winged helix-turn-helix (wHTH) protein/Flp pilus assembly protein TadD
MTERPFVLGPWRVDPPAGALTPRDGGGETRLEPRLMALLLLFAASPGRVIGKDEIVTAVWGGRAIGDDTLAAAVSRLRSALGETKGDRYIETLPKRGYRLVVPTDRAAAASGGPPAASTGDSETLALVAQGRAALAVPVPANLAQAQLYFDAAVKADPACASAHAGLAETLVVQTFLGMAPAAAVLPAAKGAARAAIGLDPDLAVGWACLGTAILLADRDFAAADEALSKAIALDPAFAMARRQRAFALAAAGHFVDAEREARRAVELEPLSLAGRAVLMRVLLLARRYRPAIAEARRTLDLAPMAGEAWSTKGWAHMLLREGPEALDALLQSLRVWGVDDGTLAALGQAHADDGFEGLCAATADLFEAQRMVFVPRPLDIAMLRAGAGDADAAFAALEAAVEKDDPYLLALPWLPHLDRLRNDHRFGALLERVRVVG